MWKRVSLPSIEKEAFSLFFRSKSFGSAFVFCTLILLSLSLPLLSFSQTSVRVLINDQIDRTWTWEDLLVWDSHATSDKTIPLSFLLPVMDEIYWIRIEYQGESWIWEEECLAEQLHQVDVDFSQEIPVLRIGLQEPVPFDLLEVSGEQTQGKTLEVWLSREGVGFLKESIERYAKWFGLEIKVLDIPGIPDRLRAYHRARQPLPDLFLIEPNHIEPLVLNQILQRLDYLYHQNPQRIAHIAPALDSAFVWEQAIYAHPLYTDTQVIFTNPELTGEPFQPRTDQDLLQLKEIVTGKGTIPICWNAYSLYWFVPIITAFGKDPLLEDDGRVNLLDGSTKKALEWILERTREGSLVVEERDPMHALFTAGRVAMILSGSYMLESFIHLEIPHAIHPFPYYTQENRYFRPVLDVKGLAISQHTRQPILARRLLDYLSSPIVLKPFCEQYFKIPFSPTILAQMDLPDSVRHAYEKSLEYGISLPTSAVFGVWKSVFWKILRFVYTGQMTVDQAIQEAQRLIEVNSE